MKNKTSLIILFFIILSYPFLIKYNFVAHNQYEQIPLILRYLNPQYLYNDWSINLNSQFSPRIFFTVYMAISGKILSLPLAYFLNYLLAIGMISYATFYFARKLHHSNFLAILTTIFILYGEKITLGGNDLVGRDFDPSRPAFSLVILGLVLLLEHKLIFGAIIFSLASYLHPLIGIEAPVIFYMSLITALLLKKIRIKPVLKSISFYVFLSLPSFFLYLSSFISQKQSIIDRGILINIIAKVASPFHYLPSFWLPGHYFFFGLIFFLFIVSSRHIKIKLDPLAGNVIINIVLIITFLCISAFVFTEIYPVYFIIIGQFFRLTVILYWLFAVTVYSSCFIYASNDKNNIIIRYFVGLFPFLISQYNQLIIPGSTHSLYIVISLIIALLLVLNKTNIFRIITISLTIAVMALLFRHYQFQYNSLYPFITPETKIAEWVKSNLPSNSVFLTPPDFIRFRLIAQRPIIVDRLVIPFMEKGITEWMERMKDVSGLNNSSITNDNQYIEGYRKMDITRITNLNKKYNFDYIIVQKYSPLPLQVIYNDENYSIYRAN